MSSLLVIGLWVSGRGFWVPGQKTVIGLDLTPTQFRLRLSKTSQPPASPADDGESIQAVVVRLRFSGARNIDIYTNSIWSHHASQLSRFSEFWRKTDPCRCFCKPYANRKP